MFYVLLITVFYAWAGLFFTTIRALYHLHTEQLYETPVTDFVLWPTQIVRLAKSELGTLFSTIR